ncbi:hypothetical protein [Brevundimonas diminuta]|uniref:hypothetical protein n=1 Tax=Brevundimonas diminuta TaxID=293 RepID=UPI003D9A5666
MLDVDGLAALFTDAFIAWKLDEGLGSVERARAFSGRRAFLSHPAKPVVKLAKIVADRLLVRRALCELIKLKKGGGAGVWRLGEYAFPGFEKLIALVRKRG